MRYNYHKVAYYQIILFSLYGISRTKYDLQALPENRALGIYQGISGFWVGILRDTFSVINYSINNLWKQHSTKKLPQKKLFLTN